MRNSGTFEVSTPSEREIAMKRVFDAPRRMVFEALTRPELIRRWLHGPPGWEMVICDLDLKVGGTYRYLWRNADGTEMGMRGVFREIAPPDRLVVTEHFDQSWYPGDGLVTSALVEQRGRTTLTMTVRYESREARDIALKSPMEQGVAAGYDRLEELLAAMPARSASHA